MDKKDVKETNIKLCKEIIKHEVGDCMPNCDIYFPTSCKDCIFKNSKLNCKRITTEIFNIATNYLKEIDVFTGLELLTKLYNGELEENDKFIINNKEIIKLVYLTSKDIYYFVYEENNETVPNNILTDKNNKFKKYRERIIDWNKVPINTKVQVRDYNTNDWINRYYVGFDRSASLYKYITFDFKIDDKIDVFEKDEFIGDTIINLGVKWIQCRIHPNEEIKEEWYKDE